MKPPGRGQQAANIPSQCISAPKLRPSQIAHPIQMGRNINHQLAWSRYHGFQRCCCSHPMLAATLGPRTVPVSMPFKETLLFKRPVKSDLNLLSRIKILGTDFNSWHQLHWGYLLLQWVRVCWKIIWRRIPADLPSHLQQVLSAWQIPQSMSGRAQPGIPIVQIGSTGTCRKQFSPWKRLLLCDYMKLISNRKVAHHLSSEWSQWGIRAHVSHVNWHQYAPEPVWQQWLRPILWDPEESKTLKNHVASSKPTSFFLLIINQSNGRCAHGHGSLEKCFKLLGCGRNLYFPNLQ